MKKSNEPVAPIDLTPLEFPDWSGMDDSSPRITADAAITFSESYAEWFPEAFKAALLQRPEKCDVEFVL
jgi:hypothetical protein